MGCVWPAAPSKITYYMRECLILSLPPTTLLLPQLPTASTSSSTSCMMITHLITHSHHYLRSHTPLDRLFALLCLRIGRFHIPSTCRGELWMLTFHKYDVPMMMMMITHGYGVVPPLQVAPTPLPFLHMDALFCFVPPFHNHPHPPDYHYASS
jgi:hypothetical protein